MLHELFRKIYLNLNAISALLDGIKKKGKIFRIANWVTRTNYDFFIQIFYSLYLLVILVVWLVDLELCNVKIYPLVHPVTISLSHGKNTFSFCGQCSDNKYANPVTQSKKRHLKYLVRFKNDSWFWLKIATSFKQAPPTSGLTPLGLNHVTDAPTPPQPTPYADSQVVLINPSVVPLNLTPLLFLYFHTCVLFH